LGDVSDRFSKANAGSEQIRAYSKLGTTSRMVGDAVAKLARIAGRVLLAQLRTVSFSKRTS
jgi:hypothetical protein